MYDRIKKGWFAISFMVLGFESVGLILTFFMLGERPLGLRLFKRKIQVPGVQPSQEQTFSVETTKEGGQSQSPRT